MSHIDLSSNTVLPLTDPGAVWQVVSGSLEVFGVRFKDGAPVGPRRYLFAAPTHSLLIGAAEFQGQQLMAVASEGSRLERVELSDLAQSFTNDGAGAAGIESWLQKALGLFDQDEAEGPLRRSGPGERVQLAPREKLRASHGVSAWA